MKHSLPEKEITAFRKNIQSPFILPIKPQEPNKKFVSEYFWTLWHLKAAIWFSLLDKYTILQENLFLWLNFKRKFHIAAALLGSSLWVYTGFEVHRSLAPSCVSSGQDHFGTKLLICISKSLPNIIKILYTSVLPNKAW